MASTQIEGNANTPGRHVELLLLLGLDEAVERDALALAAVGEARHEERAVRADAHDRVRRLPERADRGGVHAAHLREGPLGLEVGRGQAAGHDLP